MATERATPTWVRDVPGGVVLSVWAQPGAKRSGISGKHGDCLKIRLAAPPVDGKANAELLRTLADLLGVRKASVRLLAGDTGRRKEVRIDGRSAADVAAALGHQI